MLVCELLFYGLWLFVIPGKFDKTFNRHANFAFLVVRICCLCNMYYICNLSLVKVIVFAKRFDYFIIMHKVLLIK